MRKKNLGFLLAGILCMALSIPVFADTISGGDDYVVNYTKLKQLTMNYSNKKLSSTITDLQPGDTISYTFTLKNSSNDAVYYYLSNSVISAFEDSNKSANGGAYAYELKYISDNNEETIIYSSDTVGGDDSNGLKDLTSSLEDYVYLDTFDAGQEGCVILSISLDGETDGNAYQNAAASFTMNFAVEPGVEPGSTPSGKTKTSPVQTGDYTYQFIIAGVLIALGLILVIFAIIKLKREKEEEDPHEEIQV